MYAENFASLLSLLNSLPTCNALLVFAQIHDVCSGLSTASLMIACMDYLDVNGKSFKKDACVRSVLVTTDGFLASQAP